MKWAVSVYDNLGFMIEELSKIFNTLDEAKKYGAYLTLRVCGYSEIKILPYFE